MGWRWMESYWVYQVYYWRKIKLLKMKSVKQKLVGGLEHVFYFSINIGNVIIPTVTHSMIFSEGLTVNHQAGKVFFCHAQVLCDLINAIWPGKIVGISRGLGWSQGALGAGWRGHPAHFMWRNPIINLSPGDGVYSTHINNIPVVPHKAAAEVSE